VALPERLVGLQRLDSIPLRGFPCYGTVQKGPALFQRSAFMRNALKPRTTIVIASFLAILVAVVAVQRFADPGALGVNTTGQANQSGISVIDGDTVRLGGITYRLVGFDTPERGDRALCDKERNLAEVASGRLQSLIASGDAKLEPVACACRPGTEGTRNCNFGRSCAYLKVSGKDVGPILINEGLAQAFVCGTTSCPSRRPWC
jgi:endonuclease YncB( thermonuclease family)